MNGVDSRPLVQRRTSELGEHLHHSLGPDGLGFVLIVGGVGAVADGSVAMTSNIDRQTAIKILLGIFHRYATHDDILRWAAEAPERAGECRESQPREQAPHG